MAGNSEQEKTEAPSPKRLQEAREKGQVPKSREFATLLVLGASIGTIAALSGYLTEHLSAVFNAALKIPAAASKDPQAAFDHLKSILIELPAIFGPILLAGVAAALLTPAGTNAYVFVPDKVQPKLSNLNPMNWVGNVFSWNGLAETLKSLVKAIALAGVGYLAYTGKMDTLFNSAGTGLKSAVTTGASISLVVFGWMLVVLLVVAAIDIPFQIWQYMDKLKMSRQEIKEESKDTEGNPEIKARVRSVQREMARRRMIDDVKKADVVITNPTHYAVALKYQEGKHNAPVVLAKGVDELAFKIREAANESQIPIVESPKLARAIYANTDLDREIPELLYVAVAKVLNYAFALKLFDSGIHKNRPVLGEFSVPDELDPQNNEAKD